LSGIETIKIIVEAEKEAGKIIEDAQTKAADIKRNLEFMINQQREQMLTTARKEAQLILQRAEEEGKTEAVDIERKSGERIKQLVAAAVSRKQTSVDKLISLVMESL